MDSCVSGVTLTGGGSRKRIIRPSDLQAGFMVDIESAVVSGTEYALVTCCSLQKAKELRQNDPSLRICRLPLPVLSSFLSVPDLKALCKNHKILLASSRATRDHYISAIESHLCDAGCEPTHAVLSTVGVSDAADVEDPRFASAFKLFSVDSLTCYLPPSLADITRSGFRVVCVSQSEPSGLEEHQVCIADLPLDILAPRMNIEGLRCLCAHHGVAIPAKKPKSFLVESLSKHKCHACPTLFYVLGPDSVLRPARSSTFVESNEPFVWDEYVAPDGNSFPPKPCSLSDTLKSLGGYCAALDPDIVNEGGCAICGQLVRMSDCVSLTDVDVKFHVLDQPDATRRERYQTSDPIGEIPGPVLHPSLRHACKPCLQSIQNNRRPKLSLANHLWLGDVPAALQDLTWAEKALIARVRHNRCVIRISQGHSKMIGNVISFEHPTMKVYDMLPPPKDTLNDVMAVIFTGVEPASVEDLKRTPVLVRRAKIKEALEWLILNHKDYASVQIDHNELEKYDEEGIPVAVIHKNMDVSEGNVLATAKSVFDNEDEIGSETGPCPYTVHGLTAEKFSTMTSTQRKGAALQHLAKGGHFLAVGHDPKPQSMYNNPALYPLMFPWLFPYGFGAVGQQSHESLISYDTHLRWLLMYHDKRFQKDPNFVIVTFNHQLIKQSTTGSFMMMKRSNFDRFVLSMRDLDTQTLYDVATRMRNGEYVTPKTVEEKRCFSILDQVEYVGTNVSGGVSEKKFQRAELWSLLSFINAPNWFITITPVDNKHPLCLYLAGSDVAFKPEIKGAADRLRIISQNPVACARFFHYMVSLFIEHICGWSDDENKRKGLFGKPAAYYGTVEQQGRLTLHLHFLLWIDGSPSPQTIRERLLDDHEFQQKLVEYLESCQVGEFLTGSMEEIESKFLNNEAKEKKLANVEDETDPTLTLPTVPPETLCTDVENCICDDCSEVRSWYDDFKETVDNILIRSNIHRCFAKKEKRGKTKHADGTPPPKVHPTGKGCLTENGHCTARFPREKFEVTKIHPKTGHVSLKKKEAMMNSITPAITYVTRANTDTTCLLSGTSVKATIGYVTDYVTKAAVKTHQVISAMYDVWTNPMHASTEDIKDRDHVRKLVLKVVNSLTSKLELGAPFAAFRMLGYPERYTSHEFVLFYWKSYYNFVLAQHQLQSHLLDPLDDDEDYPIDDATEDVGISRVDDGQTTPFTSELPKPGDENVHVINGSNKIYNKSATDDYRLRPQQLEAVNVYEWVQCSIKHRSCDMERARKDLRFFRFHSDHPQYESHVVACDPVRRRYMVPNFRGPPLPRRDEGDYEEYCSAMLTLFKPWRTGVDLKPATMSWEEAFELHNFSKRQLDLMNNFNVRYECYDAKDDFYAMNKHRMGGEENPTEYDPENEGMFVDEQYHVDDLADPTEVLGFRSQKDQAANDQIRRVLETVRWLSKDGPNTNGAMLHTNLKIRLNMTAADWNQVLNDEKKKATQQRLSMLKSISPDLNFPLDISKEVSNDVYVVPGSYIRRDFVPPQQDATTLMDNIIKDYNLNAEQERAFRILANHSTCIGPKQLLMYMGGMGGTGKSQVIRAWVLFFAGRNESYRCALLGPTGTSAALIGGQTYHSFLSISVREPDDLVMGIEDLRERLLGVSYLIIDEVSMIGCLDLLQISRRCQEALQSDEEVFGGMNIVLAGDFAQLPPTHGFSLYTRELTGNNPDDKLYLDYLGKSTWLQFTTAVILKKNMRQADVSQEDERFRTCSEAVMPRVL
ncbi:hypothetical protein CVT24_006993, partial [Panaeolus cyanescens]